MRWLPMGGSSREKTATTSQTVSEAYLTLTMLQVSAQLFNCSSLNSYVCALDKLLDYCRRDYDCLKTSDASRCLPDMTVDNMSSYE